MDRRPFQVRIIVNYLSTIYRDIPVKANPLDIYSGRFFGFADYILKNYEEQKIIPKPIQYFWLLISLKKELSLKGKFYSE